MPDLTLTLGSKRDQEFGARQTVVGVAIPLPLFDRNQGNVLSALRRTDKARAELLAVQARMADQRDEVRLRLDAANAELAIIERDILPGAQRAYDAASKGNEAGKFSFLDVLDAQRTLITAKNHYIRALADTYRASADMQRLTGDTGPVQ